MWDHHLMLLIQGHCSRCPNSGMGVVCQLQQPHCVQRLQDFGLNINITSFLLTSSGLNKIYRLVVLWLLVHFLPREHQQCFRGIEVQNFNKSKMQLRLDKDSISGELFIPLPIYNKSHLKVSLLPCAPQCTHNVFAGWAGYIWEFNSTEQTSFDTVLCFFSGFLKFKTTAAASCFWFQLASVWCRFSPQSALL